MSGSKSRRKGHDFERAIARLLRVVWPGSARGDQARFGTGQAPDVDGTPYYIECKAQKRVNIKAAYEQACAGAMEEARRLHSAPRTPVAITKDDRSHILVTMSLMDWKALVTKAHGGSSE